MRIRWRDFEIPNSVICEDESRKSTYGKFYVEPFERGFGITVGNSLRRILLSSLEGAALVYAKIEGVQHEFTSMTGVYEDVTEVVLNLKNVLMLKDTLDEVDEIEPFLESVICSVIAVLQGIFSIIMVVSQIKPAALWR